MSGQGVQLSGGGVIMSGGCVRCYNVQLSGCVCPAVYVVRLYVRCCMLVVFLWCPVVVFCADIFTSEKNTCKLQIVLYGMCCLAGMFNSATGGKVSGVLYMECSYGKHNTRTNCQMFI